MGITLQFGQIPGAVHVDDDRRIGSRGPHRLHALAVEPIATAELQFQHAPVAVRRRRCRHALGRIQAERAEQRKGTRHVDAEQRIDARARLLHVEVPERAVERIARAAGWQEVLKQRWVHGRQRRGIERFDLLAHRCDRLAKVVDTDDLGDRRALSSQFKHSAGMVSWRWPAMTKGVESCQSTSLQRSSSAVLMHLLRAVDRRSHRRRRAMDRPRAGRSPPQPRPPLEGGVVELRSVQTDPCAADARTRHASAAHVQVDGVCRDGRG